jgi:hypothetical protein
VKLFIRLSRIKRSLSLLLPLAVLLGQTEIYLQSVVEKEETTWNWQNRLNAVFGLNPRSFIQVDDNYNAYYLFSRNTWQEQNRLQINHSYIYSTRLNLITALNSRVLSEDETFRESSDHTLLFKPRYVLGEILSIQPSLGTGFSLQKNHDNAGIVYGLSGRSQVSEKGLGRVSLFADLRHEDFGPRQNRIYNNRVVWYDDLSAFASDSLSLGYFVNYNENFIQENSENLEENNKERRYINNTLKYKLSASSRVQLLSKYEWKLLESRRNLELPGQPIKKERDNRKDSAVENYLRFYYQGRSVFAQAGLRFRNELKRATGFNFDSRLTGLFFNTGTTLFGNDLLALNNFLSKYETYTPDDVKQDRDDLRYRLMASYRLTLRNHMQMRLMFTFNQSHQQYLFAEYSNNNFVNRLYEAGVGFGHRFLRHFHHSFGYKIRTNFDIFDFEGGTSSIRSRLVKSWAINDTLQYRLTNRLNMTYQFQYNSSGIGNWYEEELLFFRNQTRIVQQNRFAVRYFWPPFVHLNLAVTLYRFTQYNPIADAKENEQRNLIPHFELDYTPVPHTRVNLMLQMTRNAQERFGNNPGTTLRSFTRGRIRVEYFF